ncbi:VOC family protein [Streptomyces litchfieldiae]|uniref:VOC family protein n=1 Tax=Streptomyces litchfieldiae TaxID=3075543 RepID=A0ABU2MKQ2_9ACTN|nr:VOC family protein [Streptomyces sp. DSM 44938]MDT0342182.1 VOC family protein [Streptomyces sp. DSM 44938]
MRHLGLLTLVVPDYDEAIAYYTGRLGFELREDTALAPPEPPGKRWVVVAPGPGAQTGLLLARAANDRQRERVGDQTGGRVGFFLYTDDFEADFRRFTEAGVTIEKAPRDERYGRVAVFTDLYGNRWDLIQPAQGSGSPSA